jgi:UDP-2,3-diacylglucosamine pyrophosphatase LpxH
MSSGNTIKRIFISDIHMGDGRSVSPGANFYPYGWFYDDRPEMLAKFLKQYCIDDGSVKRVIIVGDLFDEWVCPTQFDPTDRDHQEQQFKNVANAPQNQLVTALFRVLASQGRLTYLRGNHDMLANKPIMEEIFPGIEHMGKDDGLDDDSHDLYRTDDGIWAEHGHWYGLFNAPYSPRSGVGFQASVLPLGFFISRITAQEVLKTGKPVNGLETFKDWIGRIHSDIPDSRDPTKAMNATTHSAIDDCLMGLFTTFVNDNAPDQHGALLNGLAGIPGFVTWEEVKDRYACIFSEWSANHPNNVTPYDAIWSDAASLDRAASCVFFNEPKIKIVICGHTHKYDFSSSLGSFQPGALTPTGTEHIYANAGAWTNDTSRCTFVETELDLDTGNHFVRLREWSQQAPGQYMARNVRPEEGIPKDVWAHSMM